VIRVYLRCRDLEVSRGAGKDLQVGRGIGFQASARKYV
jgi:hypothetical protein